MRSRFFIMKTGKDGGAVEETCFAHSNILYDDLSGRMREDHFCGYRGK